MIIALAKIARAMKILEGEALKNNVSIIEESVDPTLDKKRPPLRRI